MDIIHPIKKQEWGQNVFRFYVPDKSLIKIGEAFRLEHLKKEQLDVTINPEHS